MKLEKHNINELEIIINVMKYTDDINLFKKFLKLYLQIRKEYYLFDFESTPGASDKIIILTMLEELSKLEANLIPDKIDMIAF